MKFDKQELEKKIRDAKDLSNEDKSNLLQLLKEKKTYGLVWEDSTEDAFEQLKTQLPILREVKERQIVNDTETENYPNHILIEGENLQALVALTYTHAGMIDVIYIDPPYNTGNKDFIYNDSFIGEDDGYRHSKWLSFMEKRLRIAQTLLSEKGVIFISIDDNEQANLKLLCDSIFGGNNFIANLVWQKKFSRANDALYFSTMHDHILCYCKKNIIYSPDGWRIGLLPRQSKDPKGYSNPDNDPRGPWTSTIMSAKSGSSSLLYEIVTPSGRIVTPPNGRFWSCSRETFEQWKSENRVWFGKNGDGSPRKKTFLSEVQGGLRPNTLILQEEGGNNQEGKQELKSIMDGEGVFDGPKPTKLINLLLKIANGKDNTILDFFAGSGTTMHATMQLNAEDGGHRQCILVTNNENGICENVTYERNKRVIEGYTTPKGDQIEGLKANNLRYYKVDFKIRKQSHQSNRDLAMNLKDLLCIKEGIYKEQEQFGALSLSGKEQMLRYFAENGRGMLMVYDTRVIPFITKEIEKMDLKEQPLKIYIFADGAYPYADDFASVIDKVSLVPMPYAYHRAIKDVLPEENVAKVDDTELSSAEQKEMMAEAIEAENNEKKEN